jgi:peptidoglycan/LPS O-acetylase OafA/YrhL
MRRIVLVTLALAVMGYKLWLLVPVWLAGAWLCRSYRGRWLPQGAARAGWLASLLLFAAYAGAGAEETLRAVGGALRLGSADRFLADYVVCVLVLANFACARDAGFSALLRIAPAVRLLASHTFTLYLSHSVVMGLWLAFYPHDRQSTGDLLLLALAIGAATVALGAVTERRRDVYRAGFERLLGARQARVDPPAVAERTGA